MIIIRQYAMYYFITLNWNVLSHNLNGTKKILRRDLQSMQILREFKMLHLLVKMI